MMGRLRKATKCAGGKVEHGTPSFSWRSLSWLSPSGQVARRLIKQLGVGGEGSGGGGTE